LELRTGEEIVICICDSLEIVKTETAGGHRIPPVGIAYR
jgi:hypothetical protein